MSDRNKLLSSVLSVLIADSEFMLSHPLFVQVTRWMGCFVG